MTARVIVGDCRAVIAAIEPNSVDAIVTDPPYEISFMSKSWDRSGVAFDPATWEAARRVLKPGGHLLAMGGTRTVHRLAVAIEDAGFEIRDQIAWLYGQGFPKSLDVSKALDKAAGIEREATGRASGARNAAGYVPGSGGAYDSAEDGKYDTTVPATDIARQWGGWGTALKPAMELIVVARKPFAGTIARNVAEHGTGALNIDGCRIPGTWTTWRSKDGDINPSAGFGDQYVNGTSRPLNVRNPEHSLGRWPANVALDEDAAAALDEQSGERKTGKGAGQSFRGEGWDRPANMLYEPRPDSGYGDAGGASRFFYTSKASRAERWGILTCVCETDKLDAWESQDRSHNGQMDSTLPPLDTSEATSADGSGSRIPSRGSENTAPFLQDSTSTTSTRIDRTTTQGTFSWSGEPSISASIADANCAKGFGGSPAVSAANSSPLIPSISTSAAKAGRSTDVVAPVTSLRSLSTGGCERCGKPRKIESHPTQKPVSLMRWLVRLVTPPGGTVLDPFTGSGTTGIACVHEGMCFVGIDLDADYVEIARRRIAHAAGPLFAGTTDTDAQDMED